MTESSPKRVKTEEKPAKLIYVVSQVILLFDYGEAVCTVKGAFLDNESAWEAAFEGIATSIDWELVLDHESGEESGEEEDKKHTSKLAEIRALSESWEKKANTLLDYIESVLGYSASNSSESWQVQSTMLNCNPDK